jgi:hypothetical protein
MGRNSQSAGKKLARSRWLGNRMRQRSRGQEWNLEFFEWYDFWLSHGIDKDQPRKVVMGKEALCMVRINENLPYQVGNITVATQGETNLGKPCRSLGKERPNTWVVKDPTLHKMYIPFLKARAQSDYRVRKGLEVGGWTFTFEEFAAKWGDLWPLRGRGSLDFSMCKIDFEKAWSTDNTDIITRREQLQRAHRYWESKGIVRRRGPGVR